MSSYKRWVIYVASAFLVLAATLTGQPQMYFMAAILLSLPVVSYLLGMLALKDLDFSRETPGSGWDGDIVDFYLVVRSKSHSARLCLEAQDHLPEWLEPDDDPCILFSAPPMATTRIPYRVRLGKRGAFRLEWLTVTAQDPLGIFAFSKRIAAESEFLVYPVPEPIPEIVLAGAERYGFRDLPIAAVRGSGVDPDGVREYVPGDPLRRVHWKSTARTGKLSVIEYEESRAVNVVIVLDRHETADVGRGKESTFEYLIRMAASLAQAAVRQGASVRLVTDDDGQSEITGRGSEHLYAVLGGLARAEANDRERLSANIVKRVGILAPGTTMVVLTSGMDTALPDALMHYTTNGAQVVVVYADPRTFDVGASLPTRDAQRAFIEGLFAAKTAPFLLSHYPERVLRPEAIEDVHLLQ